MLKKANKQYPVLNNGRVLPTAKDWNEIIETLNSIQNGSGSTRIQNQANDTYVDTDLNNQTVNIVGVAEVNVDSPKIILASGNGSGYTSIGKDVTSNFGRVTVNTATNAIGIISNAAVSIGDPNGINNSTNIVVSDGARSINIRAISTSIGSTVKPRIDVSVITGEISAVADIIKLPNIPEYADNATAVADGYPVDGVYKTSAGELRIVV